MRLRSFVRSGSIYGGANVIASAVPFLLLPILTRALPPEEYGAVIAFYILVSVCAALAGLGLQSAVGVRWLDRAKGDPRDYTASAVVLVAVSTACAALLAAAVAPLVGIELSPMLCALAAVLAGANVLQAIRFAVWQSQERPLPAAVLQVSSAVLNVGLSLFAVFVVGLGGEGRILGATVAGLIIGLACIHSLRRDGSSGESTPGDLRQLIRFGLPLIPHALAAALLVSADRFAVSAQLGAAALGVYGTASQLGTVVTVLADAASKAYAPVMYRQLSLRSELGRLRLVAIAYLSAPAWILVALGLWLVFQLIGPLLLGAEYREGIALSLWFLIGGALGGVYLHVAGLFFFSGRTEWISVASVTAALVAMAAAGPAVRTFGVHGGGATFVGAQVLLLVGAWVLSLRVSPMPWGHPFLAFRELRTVLGIR